MSYSATSASMDILNVAVSDGVMLGSLNYNGKVYKFKPADNGDTLIVEMDDVTDKTVAAPAVGSGGGASLDGDESASMGCNDDGKMIDVVVAYTPEFVDEVGGAGNVGAYMAQLEQETNLSFQLSGVSTRVDIVDSYATDYRDSTNVKKDWAFFVAGRVEPVAPGAGASQGDKDKYASDKAKYDTWKELHDKRKEKYADIMVVLTGNMGYDACGVAPVKANSNNALAIIREGCGTGYYQFAHDIGHIFGTNHNIDTTQAPGTNEGYAHGYCGNGWRSIMSFNCTSGGGKRKPIWSTPGNTFNGEATGVAGISNNVKVLNENAKRVDNFQCAPAVPTKVTGLKPSGSMVNNTVPFHYEWKPSPSATKYTIKVTDSSGNVFEKSYSSSDANCTEDGCSVASEQMPADGIVKWTVTPENADKKAGPVSDGAIFTVTPVPQLPEAPDLIAPGGIISVPRPAFRWKPVANTSEYYITVYTVGGVAESRVFSLVISASDANCPSGGESECSTVLSVDLPANTPVMWWMASKNDAGWGKDWSEGKEVTYFQ